MKTHIYLCDYFDKHSRHDGRGRAFCGKILNMDSFTSKRPLCDVCNKKKEAFKKADRKAMRLRGG